MNKTIRYHIKWFYVYQIMNSGKPSVQLLNLLVYACFDENVFYQFPQYDHITEVTNRIWDIV